MPRRRISAVEFPWDNDDQAASDWRARRRKRAHAACGEIP
jgi:hypothetical protein